MTGTWVCILLCLNAGSDIIIIGSTFKYTNHWSSISFRRGLQQLRKDFQVGPVNKSSFFNMF